MKIWRLAQHHKTDKKKETTDHTDKLMDDFMISIWNSCKPVELIWEYRLPGSIFLTNTTVTYYTLIMKLPGIDWDENKNTINKAKHKGLSFESAQYVFTDPQRIARRDESEENTSGEERRQTLGMVDKVLMVVYTEISETKKIISARLAERPERRSYHGYYQIDGKGWEKDS